MSLIVTGTLGIDSVETPTGSAERVPGGSAAYFCAAASAQGPVRLVGVVGGDWPEEHHAALRGFEGIDLSGLERREDSSTFAWGGRYLENMNERETLFTELGVLEEAPPSIPDSFVDSELVFLANSHPAVQKSFLEQFARRRLSVVDSMDLWINIARPELDEVISAVDGVLLNDSEVQQLTGIGNPYSAAREILQMGPSFVIVKKGEHGAVLVHRDGTVVVPAFPVPLEGVVDPTGAGDSFAGGFMGYLERTGRLDFEALRAALGWGTVTASFTLERFGLEGLRGLDLPRLEDRFDQLVRMTRLT